MRWCRVGQAGDCATGEDCLSNLYAGLTGIGLCKASPPPGWSCSLDWYVDGLCDCNCTVWDPDCDDLANQQIDCTSPEVCLTAGNPGTCGPPT